jgi:hypothetical protein
VGEAEVREVVRAPGGHGDDVVDAGAARIGPRDVEVDGVVADAAVGAVAGDDLAELACAAALPGVA